MKKYIWLLIITLLIVPIGVQAASSDTPFYVGYMWVAFCTIHVSLAFLSPLAKILASTPEDVKKKFWTLFVVRIIALLILVPIFTLPMMLIDFFSAFFGAFIVTPICTIMKKDHLSITTPKIQTTMISNFPTNVNQIMATANTKINCPRCGYEMSPANTRCPSCGMIIAQTTPVIVQTNICPSCHKEYVSNIKYCPICGADCQPTTTTNLRPSVINAKDGTPLDRKQFDPSLFNYSEEKTLRDFVDKELKKPEFNNIKTLPSIEKRKSILTLIYAVIMMLMITIYVSYHVQLPLLLVIFIILTIIYFGMVRNYNINDYIRKEITARPDEKITYVVSSIASAANESTAPHVFLRILILGIFIIVPIMIFQEPHLIYEKQQEEYVVRYYTLGILKTEKKVTIPKSYKNLPVTGIRGDVFKNVQSIKEVSLPDTIKEIRGGAFQNCQNLEKINLPVGIKEIHGSTFEDCYSLQSIIIPEGVWRIGGSAFRNCRNLQEATIPKTVTEIGSSAFRNTELTSVCISQNASVNERAFKETYPTITYYENDCQEQENTNTGRSYYYGY